MTATTISKNLGKQPQSVTRKIKRAGYGSFGINETLPKNVIDFVLNGKQRIEVVPKTVDKPVKILTEGSTTKARVSRDRLARPLHVSKIAIPLLAIPASFGVFFFASHFIPFGFALIEAAGFEMVYIGLAAMRGVTDKKRKYVQRVSFAAVFVSVVYNTIAAAIHLNPDVLNNINIWLISLVHGLPLSLVAYLMVDLTIRR